MPRDASRITLEIVSVRAERVQDISAEDAEAEGMLHTNDGHCKALIQFKDLWNSINEKRGAGWDENPYVWVIKFKKI